MACLEDGSPDARASGREMLRILHDKIMKAATFKDHSDKLPRGQQLKVQKVMYLDGKQLYNDFHCTTALNGLECN